MSDERPLGAVLAGGRGSRIGGGKPTIELAGRPLISYRLAAIEAAGLGGGRLRPSPGRSQRHPVVPLS
jgi:CTP:molybdopterin cytidylyltransferase MocA